MAFKIPRFLRDMLDLDETDKTAGNVIAVNATEDGYELVAPTAGGGGGAPTDATYIVQTGDAGLSAEQALGDLATGILKNTTTTGVLSIAAANTDYAAATHASRHQDGGADEISLQGLAGTPADLQTHIDDTSDAHAASAITNTPAGNISSTTVQAAINELDSEKQAKDATLDTYAGIDPSANVQSVLSAADYAAIRTLLGLVIGTNVQAYDADLTTYAGISPSANVQSLLGAADYAAIRTLLGLVIGTNVQAYDADLTTWAGLTPSAFFQTLVDDTDAATGRGTLGAAPVAAKYIVQTADSELSAEQALGALATGMLKNTTTTGVLSIGTEGTDYYKPTGTDVTLADGGTGTSLSDPNADRIMFWDDSAGHVDWLTPGTGLTITGTTIDASGSSTTVDDSSLVISMEVYA